MFISGHNNTQPRDEREGVVPFKMDGVYCLLVQLTKNQWAIIDAEDIERVSEHIWRAKWAKSTGSYYVVTKVIINGKRVEISLHRFLLGLPPGEIKNGDHKNRITLDNRRKNLRPASDSDNARNSRKPSRNTSGYKGVSATKVSWRAQLEINGKHISLGCYKTAYEAHLAYCYAAAFYFGEFARVA